MKEDLVALRHAKSAKDFPELKLEEDEFVELALRRAKIGVVLIWAGVLLVAVALTAALALFNMSNQIAFDVVSFKYLKILLIALYLVMMVSGIIMTVVYNSNRIYITNRRIIQKEMTSLFSRSTNVIELVSIEDVSFKQAGILQYVCRYGTLRMATVGDETTYTFTFLNKPKDEMDLITHLVHTAKD